MCVENVRGADLFFFVCVAYMTCIHVQVDVCMRVCMRACVCCARVCEPLCVARVSVLFLCVL